MRPVITAVQDEQFVVVKYRLDYAEMSALIKFNEVNDAPAGSTRSYPMRPRLKRYGH